MPTLAKCPTGIAGLDQITLGGLPRGRPTLVCGSAGSGKTLLAIEFLVRGATEFGEPGVFVAFEETSEDLLKNVASLGFDLAALERRKKLLIDHIRVERSEIEETGEYDLEGLFIRLNHAIDSIGAKRIVLDTIETLFGGLSNTAILRSELRRLFRWLKDKGVTAVITGERGNEGSTGLTRQGLEEYVSDCVIALDHRVRNQISTRRLRIVKYRGSVHGTNEYPFLIDESGFSVLPITALGLAHDVSVERISSGIPRLDTMLGGKGFYRGSSVLITGTAGTGKSSLAASIAEAACRRGERCVYFAFEESAAQVVRNMRSIGVDLGPHLKSGLLRFHASRPTVYGLEMHLAMMHKVIEEADPSVIVVDPVSNLINAGNVEDANALLVRLVDYLKSRRATAVFTSLSHGGSALEATELGVSSIMDTWILLRDIEHAGERTRGVYILKSRGMAHSNQIREFILTDRGIQLVDVYTGPGGVLTGSARLAQEAQEEGQTLIRRQELEVDRRRLARKQAAIEAQIASLRAELAAEVAEAERAEAVEAERQARLTTTVRALARSRRADAGNVNGDRIESKPSRAKAAPDKRAARNGQGAR